MAMLILPPNWPNVGFFPEILVDWRKIEALEDMATKVRKLLLIAVAWMVRSNCCALVHECDEK